jgi:C-terminal processing protease CtpA/Prc
MTYWESENELDPHDLDQVGVTLEKRGNGYFIAGIAEKDGKPSVNGVRTGDKLIQIDNVIVTEATRGAVFAALHGKPGAIRMLVLERNGKRLRVPAKVSPF